MTNFIIRNEMKHIINFFNIMKFKCVHFGKGNVLIIHHIGDQNKILNRCATE